MCVDVLPGITEHALKCCGIVSTFYQRKKGLGI